MNRKQVSEIFTAFIASAFVHHESMIREPATAEPPTPDETRTEYQNNPTIRALTDATVIGIHGIISHNKSLKPGACDQCDYYKYECQYNFCGECGADLRTA